jgi:hypothetical protein
MVVNHVIPEIHQIIPEMNLSAYMFFGTTYMADNHVILEKCFMEILQVCNFGITWLSTCNSGNTPCNFGNMLRNSGNTLGNSDIS